jgi:hypothetical protein
MTKQLLGMLIIAGWLTALFGFFIVTATDRVRYIISIAPMVLLIVFTIFRSQTTKR